MYGFLQRLDIGLVLQKSSATLDVAPHGLIGQTFDGDGVAVDGAVDDYSPDIVVTSVRVYNWRHVAYKLRLAPFSDNTLRAWGSGRRQDFLAFERVMHIIKCPGLEGEGNTTKRRF